MLFNSYLFLFFFLPLVLFLFYNFKHSFVTSRIILIISGLIFYSHWNINFLPIIICSVLLNFFFGHILLRVKKKKFLIMFIFINILILGIFKYTDFIILNLNVLFNQNIKLWNIQFPLAISFFTFQQITYLVDCFNNVIKKKKFLDYSLFVVFFPQLIAGPIVKFNYLVKQFNFGKNFFLDHFPLGFFILSIGLFKKLVLADNFAHVVNSGYLNSANLDFIQGWFVSFCFMFQFYFDFSGYIDIATGVALMFGVVLPQNFNSPYKATNLVDFWQRWHITLTSFLTNYIYLPIAKSFSNLTFLKSSILIIFVFFISGLWHGPSWLFIIFGLMHGFGIILNQIVSKYQIINLNKKISWGLTFTYVNISLVFFRSESFEQASNIFKSMFFFNGVSLPSYFNGYVNLGEKISYEGLFNYLGISTISKFYFLILMIFSFLIIFRKENSYDFLKSFKCNYRYLLFSITIFLLSINRINSGIEFIYFKF